MKGAELRTFGGHDAHRQCSSRRVRQPAAPQRRENDQKSRCPGVDPALEAAVIEPLSDEPDVQQALRDLVSTIYG
jgi:hypothetical protein